MSHNDVKHWLPQKLRMNQILWSHGQRITEHGKKYHLKHKAISAKLMFCWAREAHDRKRITDGQLERILKNLPKLDVELESPSLAESTDEDAQPIPPSEMPNPDHRLVNRPRIPPTVNTPEASLLPSVNPPPPVRHPPPTLVSQVDSMYAKYRGTLTFVEVEEEVNDVATSQAAYASINVLSDGAIFYAKDVDIERQIESCFKRTQDLFSLYGKDSRAMIVEAVTNKTSFGPNW